MLDRLIAKLFTTNKHVPVVGFVVSALSVLIVLVVILIKRGTMQLLDPAGPIALLQSRILWGAIILAAVVGCSLIGSFFFVVIRYRDGQHARYEPEWTAGKRLELGGWGVLIAAMAILSVLVWITAHQVDPYRPLQSSKPPIVVQVVALQWKWLFIYPNDRIASVNALEVPVGTPIALQLTAEAPMNSFWVPRLSGQVYAMNGMVTELHLQADQPGTFAGSSAEISGADFADMNFTVKADTPEAYHRWQTYARLATQPLDDTTYARLARPSTVDTPVVYTLADPDLFRNIVMKFMPSGGYNMPMLMSQGMGM